MKKPYIFITLVNIFLIVSCASHNRNNLSLVESDYLGQKPPGQVPEAFAQIHL